MGSEQHYSLRWNDYTVKIVTAFQSLRDEEDFVDVTVACDGHSYSAHKMVLSACSPYFRSLLRANPCQHPIVILKDVGHVELERLLEFMYNGEVSIAQDQLAAFLKTAENLKIRGLAGSSDEMDQAGVHRPDVSYSYSSSSALGGGVTSDRSSPSAGYAPSQSSKDDEMVGEGYHRGDSPPAKRRKRSSAPAASSAAGHADSTPATEGVAGDSSVEVDSGGTMGGGGLSGDDDGRLDRREMKSEPGDAMADVYSESSEMSTDPQSHSAIPGPSGAAGSQEGRRSHKRGASREGERRERRGVGKDTKQRAGQGSLVCSDCTKTFRCRDSLRRHQKIHRGTALQCPACAKLFVQRGDLTKHLRRRHPDFLAPLSPAPARTSSVSGPPRTPLVSGSQSPAVCGSQLPRLREIASVSGSAQNPPYCRPTLPRLHVISSVSGAASRVIPSVAGSTQSPGAIPSVSRSTPPL